MTSLPARPMVTDDVALAVDTLRRGALVALPTETVYGLGASISDPDAVARVFAVKGRPADHPLIVHVADASAIDRWARDVPVSARRLAETFWPGPLTLLLWRSDAVPDVVTGGRPTVGLRMPAQPMTLGVLGALGTGVAAPSANRFGRVSPTTAADVVAELGDAIDVVLDGGPCTVGIESTIVDLTGDEPMVLRPGGVAGEALEAALGRPVARVARGPARAPGMLASHYAPAAAVEVVDDRLGARARAAELGATGRRVRLLDADVGPVTWARELYGWLRQADHDGIEVIVVVPPPPTGLGVAVRDRLQRAASAPPPRTDRAYDAPHHG